MKTKSKQRMPRSGARGGKRKAPIAARREAVTVHEPAVVLTNGCDLGGERYLDKHQLGALLNLPARTVVRWAKQSKIPSFLIGRRRRFKRSAVEAHLEKNCLCIPDSAPRVYEGRTGQQGQRPEGRGQRSEIRDQRAEVRGQRAEN